MPLIQSKFFNKWNSLTIFLKLVSIHGLKKVKILNDKLVSIGDTKAIKNFYWIRDVKRNSIKAKFNDNNKFYETNKYLDLCYDYPELFLGFQWLMKAR